MPCARGLMWAKCKVLLGSLPATRWWLLGMDDFANIIVFLSTKGAHTAGVLLRDELFLNLYRLGRTLL